MRIITGRAKGVRLETLPGDRVRPTTEMTKEGVFSVIQFDLADATFLDLFAGSGQMGLEAVSRGAKSAVFVDCSEESLATVRKNVEKTGFRKECRLVRSEYGEYIKAAGKKNESFDFIFADAPYEKDLGAELVKRLARAGIAREGTVLMIENDREKLEEEKIPPEVIEKIASIKVYKFSKCYVHFVRFKEGEI